MADPQDEPIERRGVARALAVAALVVASLVLVASSPPASREIVQRLWQALLDAPAPVFFGLLAVALLLPVPASVLYVAAGPIYGVGPSLAWIAPALAVNALLVHAIGTTSLRPRLVDWTRRRGLRIPTLEDPSDQLLFATVVRVTPGIPYFVQSWAIVLAGIRRGAFIVLSVAIQMIYATGFVVLGRGAFEGRMGLVATSAGFLVIAGLVARHVHRRLRRRAPVLVDEPD